MSGTTLPVVMGANGLQPTPPATIRSNLVSSVSATNPDYTSNLPGSLVEDIASTDVGAIVLCDQARVELVNSLTPYGANAFLLNQLGQMFGIPQGTATNTSVYVVFSGTVGFVIAAGFLVSDGTYVYQVQDGGIIETGGSSTPLLAIATQTGSWAVPANTVTTLVTSAPVGSITLSVTNPQAGTPATGAETEQDYRSRVLQGGLVACQSTPAFLKTLLGNIPGVLTQLVSVRSVSAGWEVICGGGGDPYAIANAIYQAVGNLSQVTGSVMLLSNVTQANPGVVSTVLNHGYTTGQVVTFSGVGGMTALNTGNYTVTVIDEKTFSIGVNTTGYPAYTTGGQVLPNLRNVTVTINAYPDSYTITFVSPPQQTVNVAMTWNTVATNFVNQAAFNQTAQQAIISYVNALPIGAPINLFEMQQEIQEAIVSILNPALLTRMIFTADINNVATAPISGTGVIQGDPESYFYSTVGTVTVTQG